VMAAEDVPPNALRVTYKVTIEIEGGKRPACVAEVIGFFTIVRQAKMRAGERRTWEVRSNRESEHRECNSACPRGATSGYRWLNVVEKLASV